MGSYNAGETQGFNDCKQLHRPHVLPHKLQLDIRIITCILRIVFIFLHPSSKEVPQP